LTVFRPPKSGLIREVASLEGDNLVALTVFRPPKSGLIRGEATPLIRPDLGGLKTVNATKLLLSREATPEGWPLLRVTI
jgi:hypothetical protein